MDITHQWFVISNNLTQIIDILSLLGENVFCVYSSRTQNISAIKMFLPNISFVEYNDVFKSIPESNVSMIVILNLSITKIPDKRLGLLQRHKSKKMVIDNHPFLGTEKQHYVYFPYSIFDKSILGYDHIYEAERYIDIDYVIERVKPYTRCFLQSIFSDIEYVQLPLTTSEHEEYVKTKEYLFSTESSPTAIIRKLKKFVNNTITMKSSKPSFNLLNLSNFYTQYQSGLRTVIHSDTKVDLYLTSKLKEYIHSANKFVGELWEQSYS